MNDDQITLEELLAEFEKLDAQHKRDSEQFRTTKELARDWGKSGRTVRQILNRCHDEKLLETRQVVRKAIDGYTRPVSAYRIKRPKGRKK